MVNPLVFDRVSSRADLEVGIYLPGVLDYLLGLRAIGSCDNEQARESDICMGENAGACGVAVDGVDVVSSQLVDNGAVHFDDGVRDSVGVERLADDGPHPSKADHHNVVAKLGWGGRGNLNVARYAEPLKKA